MMQADSVLEPSLAALVARMSQHPRRAKSTLSGLADGLTSAPLAAFVRAVDAHVWPRGFGRFEVEAERMEENGYYDELVELLEDYGHADAEGILIGTTGGGEEGLFMVADDQAPGHYVIYRFAYDGMPYSNGQPLLPIGQMADLLSALAAEEPLDPELEAVLAEAPPDRPAPVTPAVPSDGLVLRRVEPPIELSDEEKRECFASAYENVEVREAAQLAFRSPEGRIAAFVNGYPGGTHTNHMLLAGLDGAMIVHDTEVETNWGAWFGGHPSDERGLLGRGTDLLEMDLRTGATTRLGPRPMFAGYLWLQGRERVLTLDRSDEIVRVWAHEAGRPLGDTPLGEFSLDGGKWHDFAIFGYDAFLKPVPTDEGRTYHLVRFVEAETLELESLGRLRVKEADLDASKRWASKTLGGVPYIIVDGAWFRL